MNCAEVECLILLSALPLWQRRAVSRSHQWQEMSHLSWASQIGMCISWHFFFSALNICFSSLFFFLANLPDFRLFCALVYNCKRQSTNAVFQELEKPKPLLLWSWKVRLRHMRGRKNTFLTCLDSRWYPSVNHMAEASKPGSGQTGIVVHVWL